MRPTQVSRDITHERQYHRRWAAPGWTAYAVFGDAIGFADATAILRRPRQCDVFAVHERGSLDEIENPNPHVAPTTGTPRTAMAAGFGKPFFGGGSYTECSERRTREWRRSSITELPARRSRQCDPGHYYLLNNYNPDISVRQQRVHDHTQQHAFTFTTKQRSIGDVLLDHHVSWKSYNDQWAQYLRTKYSRIWHRG